MNAVGKTITMNTTKRHVVKQAILDGIKVGASLAIKDLDKQSKGSEFHNEMKDEFKKIYGAEPHDLPATYETFANSADKIYRDVLAVYFKNL